MHLISVILLFFALSPTQAINQAKALWGSGAYIRSTRMATSTAWIYEVGNNGMMYGSSTGSYDKAFAIANVPELPVVTISSNAFIMEPFFVEFNETICNTPVQTGFGLMPYDPACRQTEARLRVFELFKQLCLANTAKCEIEMKKAKVSFRVN